MEKILISACLLGLKTRYDGTDALDERLRELAHRYTLIPICPELLGELGVPREPATIEEGDGSFFWKRKGMVILQDGTDVSGSFRTGAERTAALAKCLQVSQAILKEGSPSCGICETNVSFNRIEGIGIAAFLLRERGCRIDSVDSFLELSRHSSLNPL
jgi:uncharacterized protein YbbK (DUF523 family)